MLCNIAMENGPFIKITIKHRGKYMEIHENPTSMNVGRSCLKENRKPMNSIATVDPQYVCLLEGKQQHFDLTNQKRDLL